jgi:sec-independent protein translocase protein TatA
MSPSLWQIGVVIALIVLLFGRGKISSLMGDVAKGIKSFKKGMKDPVQDQSDTHSSQDQSDTSSSQDQSSEEDNSDKK